MDPRTTRLCTACQASRTLLIATALGLFACSSSAADPVNNVLRGLITYKSSNSAPVKDVEINAPGANKTYSDDAGYFELRFGAKRAGDKVTLVVHKPDLILLNAKEVERVFIPANPDELIRLVMVRPEERNAQLMQFYGVIVEAANTDFRKALDGINQKLGPLHAHQSKERAELLERIRKLEEERDRQIARAESIAERLSNVDLDQASALAKSAFAAFNSGDVKKAIAILRDELLDETMRSAQEAKQRARERLKAARNAVSESIENYMIKARFCIADQAFGDADRNFLKAVEADLTRYKNVNEYLSYLWAQQSYDRAVSVAQRALGATPRLEDKADLWYWIGILGYRASRHDVVLDNLQRALSAYTSLDKDNPGEFKEGIASTQNALGVYYESIDRPEDAMHAFERSLKLRDNKDDDGSALTLMNLGSLYGRRNEVAKAVGYYERSLKILRRLAAEEPEDESHRENLARALMGLGGLHGRFRKAARAREALVESEAILRAIAQKRGQSYQLLVASALSNRSDLELVERNFEAARKALEEELTIYRSLGQDAQMIQPPLSVALEKLGQYHMEVKAYDKALGYLQQSLQIRTDLERKHPHVYQYNIARSLQSMAEAYGHLGKVDDMYKHYSEALVIYRRIALKNPIYRTSVAATLVELAAARVKERDLIKAAAEYQEAHDLYEALWRSEASAYATALCWAKVSLAETHESLLRAQPEQPRMDIAMRFVREAKELAGTEAVDEALPACIASADGVGARLERDTLEFLRARASDRAAVSSARADRKEEFRNHYRNAVAHYRDAMRSTGRISYKATLAAACLRFSELEDDKVAKGKLLDEAVNLRREISAAEGSPSANLQIARALTARGRAKLTSAVSEARADFIEALDYHLAMNASAKRNAWTTLETGDVYRLLAETESSYARRAGHYERLVTLLESVLPSSTGDAESHPQIVAALTSDHGNLSFYQLFAGRLEDAEKSAARALELDPANEWVKTNLGHSLLLRGEYERALSIYQQLKGRSYDNRAFKTVLLEDFDLFAKSNIVHPDVARARDVIVRW